VRIKTAPKSGSKVALEAAFLFRIFINYVDEMGDF